jgi:hypothetical protein
MYYVAKQREAGGEFIVTGNGLIVKRNKESQKFKMRAKQ